MRRVNVTSFAAMATSRIAATRSRSIPTRTVRARSRPTSVIRRLRSPVRLRPPGNLGRLTRRLAPDSPLRMVAPPRRLRRLTSAGEAGGGDIVVEDVVPGQVGRFAGEGDAAAVQDRHVVGELERQVDVLLDDQE